MTDYSSLKNKVDAEVKAWCNSLTGNKLSDAIAYALDGGKRLRPVMLLAANAVARGRADEAMPFAVAVELIHNYSLIHDDLPCMDNDVLRRGRPTVHKKFGEWTALLAGDALLNGAYELILKSSETRNQVRAGRLLSEAAGIEGMIHGQYLDLSPNTSVKNGSGLSEIYRYKTGALFVGALTAGATLAGASKKIIEALTDFGVYFGEAFQIKDDLDDFYTLPKNDKKLKYNYAVIFGERCAEADLSKNIDMAKQLLYGLKNTEILTEIVNLL